MFTIFKHTLAVFAVIAVAAAPSAAYAGVELNPSGAVGASGQTQAVTHPAAPLALFGRVNGVPNCPPKGVCVALTSVQPHSGAAHSARPTAASSQQAFQWGDAGIGAAGVVLLLGGVAAAAIATRRQRHSPTAS